jgi:hypothetical protein
LRSAQHGLQFKIGQLLLDAGQLFFQLGLQAGIFFGELHQRVQVPYPGFQVGERVEQRVERLELLDGLPGFFLVVPEGRPSHQLGQLGAKGLLGGDVKDCPAAE